MRSAPSAIDQVFRHWPVDWPTAPRALADLPNCVYVNCENVARHVDACIESQSSSTGRVAPPWPLAVLFWSRHSPGLGTLRTAVLIRAFDPEPGIERFQLHGVVLQHRSHDPRSMLAGLFCVVVSPDGFLRRNDDGTEVLEAAMLGTQPSWVPELRSSTALATALCGPTEVRFAQHAAKSSPEMWFESTRHDIAISLFAFSLANCRNVVQRDRGRTSPPRPWQKAGVPTVRYRVLAIDGRATTVGGASEATDPSAPHRRLSLHIVRGHFAHYTPERPLFGKYAGTFWMPQHVRGSSSDGVVVKDYSLGPQDLADAGAVR